MSCWSGFLSLRLLRRRGGKAQTQKELFRDKSCGGCQVYPAVAPRGCSGEAEQSRPESLPGSSFLFHTTIRQFQPKIPRIASQPGSTIVLGGLFCFGFFPHTI